MKISEHAYQRARERLGWNRDALKRMFPRILEKGKRHSDTKGNLYKYLSGEFSTHRASDVRIYGENLFFFRGKSLATIYQIPNSLKKCL